jgi:hypothetical protein
MGSVLLRFTAIKQRDLALQAILCESASNIDPRIASPGMLLEKFPPMIGAALPNRLGGAHGRNYQHGRASRGFVSGGGGSISNHFSPIVGWKFANPVILPPGLAKSATNPLPIGSETETKTSGVVADFSLQDGRDMV